MADVEQIAANESLSDERFSVIETEKGYAVWDDVRNEIYTDGDGVQEEFASEWQVEDYLKQVKKAVADKEAAEWLAVERAKQENPPQDPSEKAAGTGTTEKTAEQVFTVTTEANRFITVSESEFERLKKLLDENGIPYAANKRDGAVKVSFNPEFEAAIINIVWAFDDELIGKKLTIEGRRYVVESISSTSDDVTLRDLTFEGSAGFPINRVEKIDTVRQLLEQAEKEPEPLATPAPRRKAKVSPFVLHPEIPAADRHEYQITNDAIGVGTPGERFNNNVRAIRLLKKLDAEDRFATPEEQAVLAQ